MTSLRRLTVHRSKAGSSLLEFLANELGISKKNAKRLIDARSVFVNTRRTWMAKHRLEVGDRVEVPFDEERSSPVKSSKIEILFEREGLIVVNKPPGIVSDGEHSVESALRSQLNRPTLRAVHRLDKDTSGCLMFALEEDAREKAISAFESLTVQKVYLVVVLGELDRDLGTIDSPIEGKTAITHCSVLDSSPSATLVKATLETGRMHQIRRHLASRKLSIVGDKLYGPQTVSASKLRSIPRQMLHAWKLAISSLGVNTSATPPSDFLETLGILGLELPSPSKN